MEPESDFFSYTPVQGGAGSSHHHAGAGAGPAHARGGRGARPHAHQSPALARDKFEALHRLSPLGRSSTAQDVASAVLFALTNQSLTGTTVLVDGGQHLMRFERDFP